MAKTRLNGGKNVPLDGSLLQFSLVLPVFLVNLVSKADGVDDSQLEAHVTLLQFVGVGLECDSRLAVLCGLTLELGVKQRVHQGGFSKTRLT